MNRSFLLNGNMDFIELGQLLTLLVSVVVSREGGGSVTTCVSVSQDNHRRETVLTGGGEEDCWGEGTGL